LIAVSWRAASRASGLAVLVVEISEKRTNATETIGTITMATKKSVRRFRNDIGVRAQRSPRAG
jgi:hypothetical protein